MKLAFAKISLVFLSVIEFLLTAIFALFNCLLWPFLAWEKWADEVVLQHERKNRNR